jgi:hypothetical protein
VPPVEPGSARHDGDTPGHVEQPER